MANLLDSIKEHLSSELLGQAASHLGESENSIMKAAAGLAPTILAGILNKSGDAQAMGNIFNQLSDSRNAGFLDNLGSLIGGGNLAHNDPKDIAGRLMGTLFGGKTQAIISALSSFAGLKSSSVSSLMGLVGPLVMGVLQKKIMSGGLNVSGLLNLLKGEQSSILNALPSGMGSVLGLADMGNIGGSMPNIEGPKTEGSNWLWPLLLLLGLGGGVLWYMKGCSKPVVEAPKIEMPKVEVPTVEVPKVFEKMLGSIKITGALDGIESGLIAFIEDASKPVDKTTWFTFDHLNFQTGSAELDMDYSKGQLTNIYEIMKAYPKVKLKVGGYTDNVGNEASNMKLSQKRAETVVNELVKMGVDKARLAPEGYGPQHPKCPANDTEECRAKNRRIDVRVMEK